jgi:hypothetical protein
VNKQRIWPDYFMGIFGLERVAPTDAELEGRVDLMEFVRSHAYAQAFAHLQVACQEWWGVNTCRLTLESTPDSGMPLLVVHVTTAQAHEEFREGRRAVFKSLRDQCHDRFCEVLGIVRDNSDG